MVNGSSCRRMPSLNDRRSSADVRSVRFGHPRVCSAFAGGKPRTRKSRVENSSIGNVLRHDNIVDEVIYEIVTLELPALETAVVAIEGSLDEPGAEGS